MCAARPSAALAWLLTSHKDPAQAGRTCKCWAEDMWKYSLICPPLARLPQNWPRPALLTHDEILAVPFWNSALQLRLTDGQSGRCRLSSCRLTIALSSPVTWRAAGNIAVAGPQPLPLGTKSRGQGRFPVTAGPAQAHAVDDVAYGCMAHAQEPSPGIKKKIKKQQNFLALVVPFIVHHVILGVIACSSGNHSWSFVSQTCQASSVSEEQETHSRWAVKSLGSTGKAQQRKKRGGGGRGEEEEFLGQK